MIKYYYYYLGEYTHMSLLNNFVSVIVAVSTAFTSSFAEAPLTDPPSITQNSTQSQIEAASSLAISSNMNAGIVLIDRANKNKMNTNGELSHNPFPLQSLGRLPILMYAIKNDKQVARGNVREIYSMMQSSSGEATNKLWDKYGRGEIIKDLATQYNLQETETSNEWFAVKMSAVDLGRLYRRFLDDNSVSTNEKKFFIELLRRTSFNISGEDFSWGLPTSFGLAGDDASPESDALDENKTLAWAQGWSPTGQAPMIRSTTGVINPDMRYIVIVHGQLPESTSNSQANDVSTRVTQEIVKEDLLKSKAGKEDPAGEKFLKKQKAKFGDFVDDTV